jgi:hypothetical protein
MTKREEIVEEVMRAIKDGINEYKSNSTLPMQLDVIANRSADKLLALFPPVLSEEEIEGFLQEYFIKSMRTEVKFNTKELSHALAGKVEKKESNTNLMIDIRNQIKTLLEQGKSRKEISSQLGLPFSLVQSVIDRNNLEHKFPKQFPISACCNTSVKTHKIYTCEACGQGCKLAEWNKPQEYCSCKEKHLVSEIEKDWCLICHKPIPIYLCKKHLEVNCGECFKFLHKPLP